MTGVTSRVDESIMPHECPFRGGIIRSSKLRSRKWTSPSNIESSRILDSSFLFESWCHH